MHTVPRDALPEPRERRTFPFGGTPLPSPAPSAISSSRSSRSQTAAYKQGDKPEIPYILTAAGIEIIGEPGPASREYVPSKTPIPRIMRQSHKHHLYNAYNNFGHWDVRNNMDPFLVAENVPKWSTTSYNYGSHYYHPQQKFARGLKNRMPVWQYDDSRRFCYYPEEKNNKREY
ncbi:unnamed protein product [Amoebophrya sp. A120]|nr:unnamed protein product [Amoebophrya sp. A120]|eukprot:GSA120T00013848001.1